MTIVLPATLATAAACGLLNIWLAVRVGQMRRLHRVSVGDGDNMAVIARMRAHANFVEYAPFVLILLGLLELAKGPSLYAWGYGFVFVLARVCHGFGMDTWKPGRAIGVGLTMLVLLLLAGEAAWTAYAAQPVHTSPVLTLAPVPAA
ncbi:MAPEG family protein [Sphingomonas sp.]|uniref:MAPEG family protein n=1 Tax=Sphingomonas sp. TaxID=28214 RepID=UPI002DD66D3F|nr:MAPEG family protein [Sphingomonas sp.]